MERFDTYSSELPEKLLCLHFAEDRLKRETDALREQVEIFKAHIGAAKRGVERIKGLRVALLHANVGLVGEEGRRVKLPDGSSSWLVQQECHPKAAWSKKHEHLLPDEVKVEETVTRVDKDLLLEWSETADPIYDERGEPVVTIEWVDPTHTRRK